MVTRFNNSLTRIASRCCSAVAVLTAFIAGHAADAQESVLPRRSVTESLADDETERTTVELEHGMPRLRVLHLLGDPPMESLIGVLERTRATLEDGTELLFEKDKLIGIESPHPPTETDDGRLSFDLERTTIIYDEDLVLPDYELIPTGDERLAVEDSFYFTDSAHGHDGLDIHFTPSQPLCVLNDCQGCDLCMDGVSYGANGCKGGKCDGDCGYCRTRWDTFRLTTDVVFLARQGGDLRLTVSDGTNAVTEDLTHGFAPGLRGTLAVALGEEQYIDLGYLGLFEWSADGSSPDLIPAAGSTLVWSGTYDATLNDYQINYLYRPLDTRWSLLCGVRYSEHEDTFTSDFVLTVPPAPPANPQLRGHADNHLLGLQVGGASEWSCGPVQLSAGFKVGVFNNETTQSGRGGMGTVNLTTPLTEFNRDGQEVSFMTDFEVAVLGPITDQVFIRAGYQGLILTELVQVRLQNGTAADAATLHYHGVFAGLEFRQ